MLAVVCCQWNEGFREYKPEYVNILQRMVARNLSIPHRFVCMTCETEGFSPEVELLKTPPEALDLAKYRSPHGERYPSSYRRLWLFSEAAKALGDRILLLDIDVVITGDLLPLVNRQEDFVGWKPRTACGTKMPRLAGGTWLLRTGTRTFVYEKFNGPEAISAARNKGYGGSDQAWISYCLADDAASWGSGLTGEGKPKDGAVIVHFNGPKKPWSSSDRFVAEHWR